MPQLRLDLSEFGARISCLAPDVWLLPGFALATCSALLRALDTIVEAAPLRTMVTPGGRTMSVVTTNAGQLGWVSDARGYRYTDLDPVSGAPWPQLPKTFSQLACDAAARAGFAGFEPDACLINCYRPGARMSLHQDRDERDFSAPIVSVSLGLPIVFLLGGLTRREPAMRVPLEHGDVLVWGGAARLRFHGVRPLADGHHPLLGTQRINLTLRKAG